LFEDHRDPLFRFLFRLTRDAEDAEDLLQETFLTVWRKRHQFEGRGSVEGYLRRTAYRLFLNARQRSLRRESIAPTVGEQDVAVVPQAAAERSEVLGFLADRVREALDGLPEPNREAFVLFRYEGLTCAQIAEASGVPLKTVETRLGRATRLLGDRLRPYRHHMSHL